MPLSIHQSIFGSDNYAVLLHEPASGRTISIDAGDEASVLAGLVATGWSLTDILVTHRHADHIAGIPALKQRFGCAVIAPAKAREAVPHADRFVAEGDQLTIGGVAIEVWETPGHCIDHVSYVLHGEKLAIVGDVMFAMGCGRVFESEPAALYRSLMRLAALPDETSIHCGHEYTLSNARFAVTVEPENTALAARAAQVAALRAEGKMTLPTTIGLEKTTNPFLRAGSPERFAELREAKNRF
jgi:hydroxyacylglutathione hydrolase